MLGVANSITRSAQAIECNARNAIDVVASATMSAHRFVPGFLGISARRGQSQ
jgi:hypothetical protein